MTHSKTPPKGETDFPSPIAQTQEEIQANWDKAKNTNSSPSPTDQIGWDANGSPI